MRRASRLRTGFMMAFTAAVIQGCDGCNESRPHCVTVDGGVVVEDELCADGGAEIDDAGDLDASNLDGGGFDGGDPDAGDVDSGASSRTRVYVYRWWYGGVTPVGRPVVGGTYAMPAGVTPGIARGGFGTPGVAHGGGE